MVEMKKSMDQLREEVWESSLSRRKEESEASGSSRMKGKGKEEERESVTGGGNVDRGKYKKLEMPMFMGSHPETWVYQAEHYFEINELTEEEKIKVAIVSFAPRVVNWFRWSNKTRKVETWNDLKQRLFSHFREASGGSLGIRLIRIKQEGTYQDYVDTFLEYLAPLPEMQENVLVDIFVSGLEPAIQNEVVGRCPSTLEECMAEAQIVNDRNIAQKLSRRGWNPMGTGRVDVGTERVGQNELGQLAIKKHDPPMVMKQVSIPVKSGEGKQEPMVRRLSDAEYRSRIENGLCFRCNEKFTPSHRCKESENRELRVFIMNEGDEKYSGENDSEGEEEWSEERKEEMREEVAAEIRALNGFPAKGTLKLKGKMLGTEVIVLIDSGATHNFLHQGLVDRLGIPIEERKGMGITVGDGSVVGGKGICKGVKLQIQGVEVEANFIELELGGLDIILGMKWLRTTGRMKIHWPSLTMKFKYHGQRVKLQGDPSLSREKCTLKMMNRS